MSLFESNECEVDQWIHELAMEINNKTAEKCSQYGISTQSSISEQEWNSSECSPKHTSFDELRNTSMTENRTTVFISSSKFETCSERKQVWSPEFVTRLNFEDLDNTKVNLLSKFNQSE